MKYGHVSGFLGSVCLSLVALAGLPTMSRADSVISTGTPNGSTGAFGQGQFITTIGQTFTTSTDPFLRNFSFSLQTNSGGGAGQFQPFVMAWNGSATTGSVLYQGPVTTLSTSGSFVTYQFSTAPFLPLAKNSTYIAFLSPTASSPNFSYNVQTVIGSGVGTLAETNGNAVDANWVSPSSGTTSAASNFSLATTPLPKPVWSALALVGVVGALKLKARKRATT